MNAVNIFAPNWFEYDSYGRVALELARGLEANGVHVNYFGTGSPRFAAIRACTGGIFLGYPTRIPEWIEQHPLAGIGARVAVTMFESTRIPLEWITPLNNCDAVVVPSPFLVDVFQSCGVSSPVHVVPLGVSDAFIAYPVRRRERGETLTFLCIGDRGGRKGWHEALLAFEMAFKRHRGYRMIVKTRHPLFPEFTNGNIEVIRGEIDNEHLANLYHKCDVMVFPSCGEGFGLPPREFAATGGIALATDWSGTADDVDRWGVPIPAGMQPAWPQDEEKAGKLGDWAHVDTHVLAGLLENVATFFEDYASQAVRGAGYVKARYRWSSFAEQVQHIWNRCREGDYASVNN